MRVQVQQGQQHVWTDTTMEHLLKNIGTMQPLLVQTQQEYDYLWAMQLMIGKEVTLLLAGEENKTGLPPSIVRIML